jgi:hypothetical protein
LLPVSATYKVGGLVLMSAATDWGASNSLPSG